MDLNSQDSSRKSQDSNEQSLLDEDHQSMTIDSSLLPFRDYEVEVISNSKVILKHNRNQDQRIEVSITQKPDGSTEFYRLPKPLSTLISTAYGKE